jgi:hypothetical protein
MRQAEGTSCGYADLSRQSVGLLQGRALGC